MFSSLKGKADGEGVEFTTTLLSALGPAIAQHWPTIEPYADKALAAAQDDEKMEQLARKIYPWLPALVRMAIKEDAFARYSIQHKELVLAKLQEAKAKYAA